MAFSGRQRLCWATTETASSVMPGQSAMPRISTFDMLVTSSLDTNHGPKLYTNSPNVTITVAIYRIRSSKGRMRSHDDCEHSDTMSSANKGIELDRVIKELTLPATVLNPTDSAESALVFVTEERGGVIYAIFITKVYVRKPRLAGLGSEVRQGWQKHFIETREVLIGLAMVIARPRASTMQACRISQSIENLSSITTQNTASRD